MRFTTLSAVVVAASAFIAGAVADGAATTTLTRTLQRVVQTTTMTRASAVSASTTTAVAAAVVNGTSVYTQPSIVASTVQKATPGAAVNLHIDAAGLLAAAGLVGFLAL